jgi:hypothetical protein
VARAAPADTLDGFAAIAVIPGQEFHSGRQTECYRQQAIANSARRAAGRFWKIAGYFREPCDEQHQTAAAIAARGGLAWFIYQTLQISRNHVA